jgi:hypothetical protein
MDPKIHSPRVQSWNVTVERQIGAAWGVAASYLGSYSDRLWDLIPLNPAIFMGLGPCTISGVAFPVCSTAANTQNRRVISLANPTIGQQISNLEVFNDFGSATYRGLKLSGQHRSAAGVSFSGNYTWSRCFGTRMLDGIHQFAIGPSNPNDLDYDRGNCTQNRTHIANATVGYQTPRASNAVVRAVASDWRVSGILSAQSGAWLTVTTGRDTALNGQLNQRVNQVERRRVRTKDARPLSQPRGVHTARHGKHSATMFAPVSRDRVCGRSTLRYQGWWRSRALRISRCDWRHSIS